MLNRGGPLSKMVSGSIGLAKEYSADRKERKAAAQAQVAQQDQQQPTSTPQNGAVSHDTDSDSSDDYEYLQALDEAQLEVSGTIRSANDVSQGSQSFNEDQVMQTFLQNQPPPVNDSPGLATYVLLPQRRPKSQAKGFVHAYAPELENCGITQATWLEFLDNFEKSISKNSMFNVLNAGVMVASNAAVLTSVISPAAHLASMAIHVGVEAARRGYINNQQNRYLDVMNEKFFKPRKLYCMVVEFSPSSQDVIQNVDLEHNITKSIGSREEQSKWKAPFTSSAMKFEGGMEMPEASPLVFPDLPSASRDSPASSWKNFTRVVGDYKDRRAAAKHEAEHPSASNMPSAPRKEFASVYGDPNSQANQGGFISLATKGNKTSLGSGGGLPARMQERRESRKAMRKKLTQPLTKKFKPGALYLMVTNLPTQEEIDLVVIEAQNKAT